MRIVTRAAKSDQPLVNVPQELQFFPKPFPFVIGVRPHYAENMTGLELFQDGLSFRSTHPIPHNKVVELVLCQGHMVIEAVITHCQAMYDERGGFAIRAKTITPNMDLQQLMALEETLTQSAASPSAQA